MSRSSQFSIVRRLKLRAVKKQSRQQLARSCRPMNQKFVEAILSRHNPQ